VKIVVIASLMAIGASAGEYDLKIDMHKLDDSMMKVQNAFITGDVKGATAAAKELDANNKAIFSNSDKVKDMLPAGKGQFANIAMNYSKNIDKATTALIEDIEAKKLDKAQSEFLNAMKACMNCHNLVRDWGKEVR